MSVVGYSGSETPRRRRARLTVGIAGWALLAIVVVTPFSIVIAAVATSLFAVSAPVVAAGSPAAGDVIVAAIVGGMIGCSVVGLVLVSVTRTGPVIGRLARPRRRLRSYFIDAGAASLVCFGASLALSPASDGSDAALIAGSPLLWLTAAAVIDTIPFVVAPVATVAGVIWLIENGAGRPLARRSLVVVVAAALLAYLSIQLLLGLADPSTPPWMAAALTGVQLGAFVFSRSALALILPHLATGSALLSLPHDGMHEGFAAGTLALGVGVALASRLRLRTAGLDQTS